MATVTAQMLSAAIVLAYFLRRGRIRLKRKNLPPALPVCRRIFWLGLPACMIQAAAALLQVELNRALVRFGTPALSGEAALGVVGVVLRISTVVVSVCVGIGVGIQPIIGFNRGAGLERRVRETVRSAAWAATAVSVAGWLVCALFPGAILRLFGMGEPAYLDFGAQCMRIFLLGMPVAGFQVVTCQYYLASGRAVRAMLLAVLRPLLLMIPLIRLLSPVWGMAGILYAGPAADYLAALIAALLLWHDRRRNGNEV